MSPGRRDEDGIRRISGSVPAPPGGTAAEEDWSGANQDKADKLRRKSLQRRTKARGVELRHSATGYALIDSARKHVEERSDMSLDEVEAWLERS